MESKHPKDMNEAECREYYFNSESWKGKSKLFKIMKVLYVFQFKFTKGPLGWREKWRFNPYNPLTYPILLLTIIYGSFTEVFKVLVEVFSELGRVFKYE